MEINIYWNDLSQEGQETLINRGLTPLEDHKEELIPIGKLETE